ncbi:MAG: pilus assembly protein TadG-related protein [Candidatus Binataceae bacterium]
MIRRRRLSRGQIAVTLIIVMTTLLGAIGLGADLSVLYYNWVILQKAADASALAGASKLTGDSATTSNSAVVSTGTTYAHTNGIGRATDTILVSPAADDKSVSVYLSRQVPYFFLQLVGVKSGKVTAKATAGVQPTNGICGAAPFGLPCRQGCNGNGCYGQGAAAGAGDATCGGAYTFNTSNLSAGTQVQLKSNQSITGVPGNWDPLAIGGNGASTYRSNIGNGEAQVLHAGDSIATETGDIVGPTAQGFSDRGLSLPNSTVATVPASPYTTLDATDPHIVVVPLVDFTAAGKNGKTAVPVLDFVTLYVTGLVGGNNTVVATVIPPVATCSTGTTTSTHPYGTGLKVVLCSDSGCPSATAWPSM